MIIVLDDVDVYVLSSPVEAEGYLEAPEVENGEFRSSR